MSMTTTATQDWNAVAAAWDNHTDYVDSHSTEATEALVAALDLQPGDRLLELAAGPGSLAPTWSDLVGPTGQALVSDIAPAMVEAARQRSAGLANVEVAVLDATSIDHPGSSFDAVACRMGLMFAPDPAVALAEIRRVLVSDGRFGALTWAGPEHNPWMTCVGMAAMMNGLVSGGPPVGPGGIFSLGDPSRLAELVEGAGFADVVVTEMPTTFQADSLEIHIARVSSLAGPMAAAFAAASPQQLIAVNKTAAQLAADYMTDAGLVLPGRALLVSAH